MEVENGTWWISVKQLDVPLRQITCDILTPEGGKEIRLGVIDDDCFEDLLGKYKKGEKKFRVQLLRGFIIFVHEEQEYSEEALERERKEDEEKVVLLTLNRGNRGEWYPPQNERIDPERSLEMAVDSILLSKRRKR